MKEELYLRRLQPEMAFTLEPYITGDLFIMLTETVAAPIVAPAAAVPDVQRALAKMQQELCAKEEVIASQQQQIDCAMAQQREMAAMIAKLEAAVKHRDGVISELASSRKLVFEECHKASLSNQAELRQMQDALHKLSHQLHQERREHRARAQDLRRQIKAARMQSADADLGLSRVLNAADWKSSSVKGGSGEPGGMYREDSCDSDLDEFAVSTPPLTCCSRENMAAAVATEDAEDEDDIDFASW